MSGPPYEHSRRHEPNRLGVRWGPLARASPLDGETLVPSALVLVEAFAPEIVVLDIELSDMNGRDLADELKQHPNCRNARMWRCLGAVASSRTVARSRMRPSPISRSRPSRFGSFAVRGQRSPPCGSGTSVATTVCSPRTHELRSCPRRVLPPRFAAGPAGAVQGQVPAPSSEYGLRAVRGPLQARTLAERQPLIEGPTASTSAFKEINAAGHTRIIDFGAVNSIF